MKLELDDPSADEPQGSPREQQLEAKLNRRTMWAVLLAFVAVTELIVMIEVMRQAS